MINSGLILQPPSPRRWLPAAPFVLGVMFLHKSVGNGHWLLFPVGNLSNAPYGVHLPVPLFEGLDGCPGHVRLQSVSTEELVRTLGTPLLGLDHAEVFLAARPPVEVVSRSGHFLEVARGVVKPRVELRFFENVLGLPLQELHLLCYHSQLAGDVGFDEIVGGFNFPSELDEVRARHLLGRHAR